MRTCIWKVCDRRTLLLKVFCGAILAPLWLISCNGPKQEGGKTSSTITIGAVLPLTGDSAAWGEQGRYGVELALEDLNAAGGVNGRNLKVRFEDSKADPKTAVSAIQKLISVDKVPAVVGDITSAATLAMAPIAERANVVLVAPSASAPAITRAGNFIFRVWPSDLLEGSTMAQYAAEKGFKRVVIFYIQTDYGTGLRDVFTSTLQARGGAVPIVQGYNKDETDFKPMLLKVSSAKPDAIYVVGYYQDTARIVKQAREMGLKIPFFGATAVESPDLVKIAGAAAEGLVYPTISDFDPNNPSGRAADFVERFSKKFGKAPDWASSHTYDSVLVIAEAMKKGGTSGTGIRDALNTQRRFDGVTGKIIFDDNGDVVDKPVVLKVIRGGKFKILQAAPSGSGNQS